MCLTLIRFNAAIPGALAGLSLAVAPAPDPWLIRIAAGLLLLILIAQSSMLWGANLGESLTFGLVDREDTQQAFLGSDDW